MFWRTVALSPGNGPSHNGETGVLLVLIQISPYKGGQSGTETLRAHFAQRRFGNGITLLLPHIFMTQLN